MRLVLNQIARRLTEKEPDPSRRGLDRSWIAELWRAQTEKADPWKDFA